MKHAQGSTLSGVRSPGESEVLLSPEDLLKQIPAVVERVGDYFQRRQAPDGFWVDELEADTSLTSEYLMLLHFLGKVDPVKEKKAVRYLLDSQLPNGGWNIFHGGPANLSSTVKAYFALKLSGLSKHEPAMQRARENVLARGGVVNANVFTKIALALFGQYDWRGIPFMPPELILLPKWFYFNLYEVSYWSRAVIIPLLIVYDKKPLCTISPDAGIDELYAVPKDRLSHEFSKDSRWLTWRNFFVNIDKVLRWYDRHHLSSLRGRALQKARQWTLEHMQGSGGLGAIYPAMANAVVALRCLGHPPDHPQILKAVREIEELEVEKENSLYLQPCHSPIWDTALAINALLDAGLSRDHPDLIRAAQWLLSKQVTKEGDWKVKVPHAEPGGWYFQFENEFYPDTDDTAAVLLALVKLNLPDERAKRREVRRGLEWLLAMQSGDGGFGAFDVDNRKMVFNQIPFADHGALLDPSTCDVTARVVEVLGLMGYPASFAPARAALEFLKKNQEPDGSWYGRWGVNYLYGTWSVLSALNTIGEDMDQPYVRRAVDWIKSRQNPDGGWGESCASYVDRACAGVGASTASQTAWAVIGLLKAGRVNDPSVRRGIRYLLNTQRPDATWEEEAFTGTGFPGVFYLRYHMYAKYFPLWALGLYHGLNTRGRSVSEDIRTIHRLNGYFKP